MIDSVSHIFTLYFRAYHKKECWVNIICVWNVESRGHSMSWLPIFIRYNMLITLTGDCHFSLNFAATLFFSLFLSSSTLLFGWFFLAREVKEPTVSNSNRTATFFLQSSFFTIWNLIGIYDFSLLLSLVYTQKWMCIVARVWMSAKIVTKKFSKLFFKGPRQWWCFPRV